MISWTNLLTRATVPAACFLLFLVPEKSENEYSRNWTGQNQSSYFTGRLTEPEYETEEGQGLATRPGLACARGWCGGPWHPLGLPFRLYIASGRKP